MRRLIEAKWPRTDCAVERGGLWASAREAPAASTVKDRTARLQVFMAHLPSLLTPKDKKGERSNVRSCYTAIRAKKSEAVIRLSFDDGQPGKTALHDQP